jgi:2'-5' RNA ligase
MGHYRHAHARGVNRESMAATGKMRRMHTPGPPGRRAPARPAQRLFTALWPTPAVRAALALCQDTWTWPRQAARVKPDQFHVTLHFLGDVPDERVPELAQALRLPFEPFTLDLGEPEVWPNGVAVVQPYATPSALQRLHAALGVRIASLGLPVESRPYRPHVTLARRAHAATPPARGPGLHWQVDDGYVLVRSGPGGAGYRVIERF